MDKTIRLDKTVIEAWGLWWIKWQEDEKERLRRHAMSPQARVDRFASLHLSVGAEGEGLGSNATGSAVLLPK